MAEPAPDPFEHFAEQELSYTAVEKHRAQLVAMARHLYAMAPEEGAGGLVLLAGSRLAEGFANAQPAGQRPDPSRQDCVTAMPREDFVRFLATVAPNAACEVPESDPPWQRCSRRLPVYVDTQHGGRLAVMTFDVE